MSAIKNFCPIRVGDILFTSLTTNPATSYLGTTWELLPSDLFVKTGNTPLQRAGSNSIKLSKANLPAEKLQVNSFSLTTQTHTHPIYGGEGSNGKNGFVADYLQSRSSTGKKICDAQSGGGTNTGTASPYTANLGSGTPLTINPAHITLKAWKRTS